MEEYYTVKLHKQDKSVLSDLYDAYGSALFGIVVRMVKSPELAQEVLENTFCTAWKNARLFDPAKIHLFSWLANIARTLSHDSLQKDRRATMLKGGIFNLSKAPPMNNLNSGMIERGITIDMASKINKRNLLLVDLMYFNGLTQKQVAYKLNIPLAMLKAHLRCAVSEIRARVASNLLPLSLD